MKFMQENINDFYTKIANHINSMIPTNWDKFYYLAEIEKNKLSWSSVFYFVDERTKEVIKSHNIPQLYNVSQDIYLQLLDELNAIVLSMYDDFIKDGKDCWEQMSLEVNDKGAFNVNYFYDVINKKNDSQVKREVIWAYNTFGLIPKEGSYTRKMLDKYLIEQSK